MRLPALLGLAATVLLLAGCVGHGPLTARAALETALKEAHGWDSDARLLSVSGAEMANAKGYLEALRTLGRDGQELDDGLARLLPDDDGDVGDGRLPAWGFVFGHDAPGTFRVIVDGSGKATFTKEFPGSANRLPDLATDSRWAVDSGDALGALRGNASLERIRDSPSGVLTYVLNAAPAGAPLRWEVEGGEHGILNQTFKARVNAANGSLLPPRTPRVVIDRPPELPPIEAGQASGTATVGASTTASFTLKEHGTVHLLLRIPGSAAPGTLRATLTLPDGQTETLQASAFLPGSGGEDEATVERIPQGEWRAAFSVPVGVTEDYTLFWCTDGAGDAPDNPAC
ncbi:MAG: hypothetical protein LC623_00390 [Halobacteriales archaeon]|nr:hypothetical protein [Halobacteriales archaeon]